MKVTKSKCKEYRRKVRETDQSMLDLSKQCPHSFQTVTRHVKGSCTHDIDVDPLDRFERQSTVKVKPSECATMRMMIRNDEDVGFAEIKEKFDISESSVHHHIRGYCSCDDEVDKIDSDLDYSHVPADVCETIRDMFEDFKNMSKVSRKTGRDRSTIYYHVSGKCSHTDKNLAHLAKHNPRVTPDDCQDIRDDLTDGLSVAETSNKYGLTKATVRKHAKCNCNCSDGPELLEVRPSHIIQDNHTQLTKGECLKCREMYWEEHRTTEVIANKSGFKSRDISYHVTDQCDHDFDEDTEYVFI